MKNLSPAEPTSARNIVYTVHFSAVDATDRVEVERFIGGIFQQAYGANITHFMPFLMSLRNLEGKLIAACGLRSAADERLFLEIYMDQPVEAILSERTRSTVLRSDIIEIGNFSVAEPGMARLLNNAIFDQLYVTSKRWAVFTVVPALHNALIKSDIFPDYLCDADISRLPPEARAEWGSYYDQKPQVMAIRRTERRRNNRL